MSYLFTHFRYLEKTYTTTAQEPSIDLIIHLLNKGIPARESSPVTKIFSIDHQIVCIFLFRKLCLITTLRQDLTHSRGFFNVGTSHGSSSIYSVIFFNIHPLYIVGCQGLVQLGG